ncbi:SDR family oxidoreductase [Methanorbis furvi]|uniref:NADP-dependent 7-alpha-hydroxysteroid dehydrogenase n=1 Tax=Methanorbis furvi TaxID=3028299 RepID=A0AAE4MAW2_9EURY|nr:NADP-dependent 7-alpha-hydroxysteroid dehydrogenase [Methanocorpusculaceae archaeon Ag1]
MTAPVKKLDGKVAVITASTKGIGLESAKLLAENGCTVYIAARSKELADEVIADIIWAGGKAKFVRFNAHEPATYTTMIEETVKAEGRLDILVNNYGSTDRSLDLDLLTGDTDAFFHIVQDNLQSVYLSSKAAIPHMIKGGGGSIVNISSIGSISPDISGLAYCVAKSAVNTLTQNIATQYARYHVRCNAVLPGMIMTDALKNNMTNEFQDSFLRHVPLNRVGEPEDIANAVLFFAGDDSSYITGHILDVAGGFGIPTPMYGDNLMR